MVNTNRMLQFHDKALEPQGASKSDAWFLYQLGKKLKALYAGSADAKDRPILNMTWDYEHEDDRERERGEPSVNKIMQEINGYYTATGDQVKGFTELADDGSTAAGGWIYSGVCPDKHTNLARSRTGGSGVSLGWGFAWPANRRLMYNRASADPDGNPWSERKKYIWWDATSGRWTGADVPDFPIEKAPNTPADPNAGGIEAHSGADPFMMQIDGRGALFVNEELQDGPIPVHYEPLASVTPNLLYKQQHNPVLRQWKRRDNPYNGAVNPEYPYVLTTYRITEYSGGMTKHIPWLAELQPAAFCEIDPVLAAEKRIRNGDWATISTAVGEIEVRGPWVTGSYYKDDDPAKFHDGWLRTGDVGTIDPLGYVTLTDRAKDVIKSGGEWISSMELENILMGHPAVAEAAVIGAAGRRRPGRRQDGERGRASGLPGRPDPALAAARAMVLHPRGPEDQRGQVR